MAFVHLRQLVLLPFFDVPLALGAIMVVGPLYRSQRPVIFAQRFSEKLKKDYFFSLHPCSGTAGTKWIMISLPSL